MKKNKNILLVANYKKSVGGISGQIDFYLDYISDCSLFNTKTSNLKRIFLPFQLLLKSKNYDVFHIHGCSNTGFFPIVIGIIVGKLTGKKNIVTYHGGGLKKFINSYPKFVNFFLKRADVITVPSQYLHKILKENDLQANYLPNIIREDNVRFKKRNEFKPILIVTRSLEKVYNISLVIKAFEILKKDFPNAKLYIVGAGSLMEDLKKEVDLLNLRDVFFLGLVKNSKIGEILNKADIYINPTNKDNMPISLFEAFACGLPVISTNVGGLPDFIKDKNNGFLINSGDVDGLVDHVHYILLHQDEIKPIIENAFMTFKKYTWENLKPEYLKLYSKIEK